MMCLHNKHARKQKPFAVGQGQTGNTMAEMKLKRNVLFFFPPQRMQGVPVGSKQHRITFHNRVRLVQSFAWLAFLGWHGDKAVSFGGIDRGADICLKTVNAFLKTAMKNSIYSFL